MAQDANTDLIAAALLDLAHGMPEVHKARLSADGAMVEVTVTPDAEPIRIPLVRLASRLRVTSPSDRPAQLRAALTAAVETAAAAAVPEESDTARFLALRTMVFAAEQATTTPVPTIAAEVVPGVAEVVYLDRPTTTAQVTRENLKRWGITAEDALRAARDNLAQAPDSSVWKRAPGSKMWQLTGGDVFTASRVFTPGWLTRNSPPGLGALFVAVPTRELIFAGRVREVGRDLARTAELVRQAWTSTHEPVSPVLYTFDSTGAVRPLSVRGDKPAARELRRSQLAHLLTAYTRQNEHRAATSSPDENWQDLRIAELKGKEVTATAWTGTSTDDMLPQAEFVMIPPVTGDVVVAWDVFRDVAGDHVQPEPGTIPQRWRTVRALTSAQLAELAERTVFRTPR